LSFPRPSSPSRLAGSFLTGWLLLTVAVLSAGCAGGRPISTPPISPGTSAAPREVNIIAHDYTFSPSVVELVAGETVLLHVVNAGLETHEAVIGDKAVQEAWEAAEAAAGNPPPRVTPLVSVPPGVAGLRLVVGSGARADAVWTVPISGALIVGCHIPGHYVKGMSVPVRLFRR